MHHADLERAISPKSHWYCLHLPSWSSIVQSILASRTREVVSKLMTLNTPVAQGANFISPIAIINGLMCRYWNWNHTLTGPLHKPVSPRMNIQASAVFVETGDVAVIMTIGDTTVSGQAIYGNRPAFSVITELVSN
jgi:hypothetical protein